MKTFKKTVLISLSFGLVLFLLSFLFYFNFSYMGARDKEIEKFLMDNFILFIIVYNLKILFFYCLISFLIGCFSFLLNIKKTVSIIMFQVFFWFFFWVRAVKLLPQLYDDQLYHRGGLLKAFQIIVTDLTPFIIIYGLFVLILLIIAFYQKRILYGFFIVLLCFLFAMRFKVSSMEPASNNHPNVLILGMDSLRPSRISYNGYFRKTPNIDSLFEKGVNFLNTKSSLARTTASFTSIFTSTYPPDHKVRYMFPGPKLIKKKQRTLIHELKKNGYETSVISDFAGDVFTLIDYGFDNIKSSHTTIQNILKQRSIEIHYFLESFLINPIAHFFFPEMSLMPLNIDSYYVKEYTKKYIKHSVKKGKPFFILSFWSNNHFPYVSKYPYYKLYTEKGYEREHKYRKMDIMKSYSGFNMGEEDKAQINGLYDGSVKLFDDEVGDILDYLRKNQLHKNTIIVIMSDHGESLYDNGYGSGHGDHLRGPFSNTLTFGVFSPFENFQGRRISQTVRDIDIAPTILDMLNIPPPATFRGKSLKPVMRGGPFKGYLAYMETGLWYSPETPYIENRIRIQYPEVKQLIEVDLDSGVIILKDQYHQRVIDAKHKAVQLNNKKYIYMPGKGEYREEFFLDEMPIKKKEINDKDFLNFKEKMIQLFPKIFVLDKNGFIREKQNEAN
jgi:hypothetical protein